MKQRAIGQSVSFTPAHFDCLVKCGAFRLFVVSLPGPCCGLRANSNHCFHCLSATRTGKPCKVWVSANNYLTKNQKNSPELLLSELGGPNDLTVPAYLELQQRSQALTRRGHKIAGSHAQIFLPSVCLVCHRHCGCEDKGSPPTTFFFVPQDAKSSSFHFDSLEVVCPPPGVTQFLDLLESLREAKHLNS